MSHGVGKPDFNGRRLIPDRFCVIIDRAPSIGPIDYVSSVKKSSFGRCSFVPAMMHRRNIGLWMRAIHPLNPLKIVSACSGGRSPSSKDDGVGRNALCGALGGHFRRRRLWSAIVVMVVVDR